MNLVTKVRVWLAGKKTYLVSGATVVYGAYEAYAVHHDWRVVVPYILASSFGGAIRAAIGKAGVQVK